MECHSETFLCGHPIIKFHKRLEFNTIVFWIIYLYYSLLWNPFARRIRANFFKNFYCLHRSLGTRHNRYSISLSRLPHRLPSLSDMWLLSRRLFPSWPLLDWYRIVIFFVLFRKLVPGVIFSGGFSYQPARGSKYFLLEPGLWLSVSTLTDIVFSNECSQLMKFNERHDLEK